MSDDIDPKTFGAVDDDNSTIIKTHTKLLDMYQILDDDRFKDTYKITAVRQELDKLIERLEEEF